MSKVPIKLVTSHPVLRAVFIIFKVPYLSLVILYSKLSCALFISCIIKLCALLATRVESFKYISSVAPNVNFMLFNLSLHSLINILAFSIVSALFSNRSNISIKAFKSALILLCLSLSGL